MGQIAKSAFYPSFAIGRLYHVEQKGKREVMSTCRTIFRWFCVVPGGILAIVLVAFPLHWIVMMNIGGWGQDGGLIEVRNTDTLRSIESWLQAVFAPLAFVYCASRIAPSFRNIVSILLTILVVLGVPLMAYWVNAHAQVHRVELSVFRSLLQVIGSIGAIYLIRIHERKKEMI